jgi:hypothetical protein
MKPVCLDLSECNGLGDLISATPTIKKIHDSYQQKITIVSQKPEIFKHNPFVEKSYKNTSIDWDYFRDNFIMHSSFYNVGKKNERGVEYKHNVCDIRQYHAIHLGFMLAKDELECFYEPTEPCKYEIPFEKYVVIHPVTTWGNRTWDAVNWMTLTKILNERGIYVVSIGKDSSETGFFNVDKPVFNFEIEHGMNLMNKTSISDCWHIISKSSAFITMDSGLLHLAGTTDANIFHLGSSINPEFRIPYRKGSQSYKYQYILGSCNSFCCSNMSHGIKEWGDLQGVAPLIGCLEKREKYDCHPTVDQVYHRLLIQSII